MNIIVAMKIVPKTEDISFDPVTKTINRAHAENQINEADKNALEYALQIRAKVGGKVTIISMGPQFFEPHLKLGIAMGADDAILLSDRAFAGADSYATALVLAQTIKKIGAYDLVLCGEESSDGGTSQVPAQVAELLDLPQITFVSGFDIVDKTVRAKRTIKGGYETVESTLPALLSIELGVNQPRFPDFKRKRWADKEFKVTVWTAKDLNLKDDETGLNGSYTNVAKLTESVPPARKKEYIEGTVEKQAKKIGEIYKKVKLYENV